MQILQRRGQTSVDMANGWEPDEMALAKICVALGLFVLSFSFARANDATPYPLGPGDHLQIKVSGFRSGMGEAYQWPMFSQANEDFVVGPDGFLSIPQIGPVKGAGQTTANVRDEIASGLQSRAGLTARPDVSVQIVKFRPFYVTGAVDKPGEYEYRPGLNVLQAVSIAGGLQRVTTDLLLGLQKDALSARGDLRVLAADRISLLARQARIDAEAQGLAAISFPKELTSSSDPNAARAMREERVLFNARRDGLKQQTAMLMQNKTYLSSEIDRLREKKAALARGLAAMQQEYAMITGLVKKGLSAVPRQLALEQNIAQLQSNQLDVDVAVVHANEDIARADRDLAEINVKYHNDLIQEAQDVRIKLAETVEKIETARQMVQHTEVSAPLLLQADVEALKRPTYRILRVDASGKAAESPARETDPVRPGDVVRVILESRDHSASQASSHTADAKN